MDENLRKYVNELIQKRKDKASKYVYENILIPYFEEQKRKSELEKQKAKAKRILEIMGYDFNPKQNIQNQTANDELNEMGNTVPKVMGTDVEPEEKVQNINGEDMVHVRDYERSDGVDVDSYWRHKPNRGASTIYANEQTGTNNLLANDTNKSDLKFELSVEKKLYPDEIAGVKRGKPMTFEEAGGKNVNPNYKSWSKKYTNICQSCVPCLEARLRGYNLEVMPSNDVSTQLAKNPWSVFINPNTGEECKPVDISEKYPQDCINALEKMVNSNERYMLVYLPSQYSNDSHSVCIYRESGELKIYDPMINKTMNKYEFEEKIKPVLFMGYPIGYPLRVGRIDDKILKPEIMSNITKPKVKSRR